MTSHALVEHFIGCLMEEGNMAHARLIQQEYMDRMNYRKSVEASMGLAPAEESTVTVHGTVVRPVGSKQAAGGGAESSKGKPRQWKSKRGGSKKEVVGPMQFIKALVTGANAVSEACLWNCRYHSPSKWFPTQEDGVIITEEAKFGEFLRFGVEENLVFNI